MKEKERAEALTQAMMAESSLSHWITLYGRYLLWILLAALFLLFIFMRLKSTNSRDAEADFLKANKEFVALENSLDKPKESQFSASLDKLQQIMARHPELHAKYDGSLAQALLGAGQADKAVPIAESAIKRTAELNDQAFLDYSRTTLLIANNQWDEALKNSAALQATLKQDQQADAVLIALNYLRMAALQRQLGLKNEEMNTWKQWKEWVAVQGPNSAIQPLLESLTEKEIQLSTYAAAREAAV